MKKKQKIGRPRIFKNPETMMEKALEYQKICLENDRPFLFIGFSSWMGIHNTTVSEYAKFPEFTETVGLIQQLAEVGLIEGGLTGKYNATFSMFMAKNKHGYSDKQEISHSGDNLINKIEIEVVTKK